MRAYQGIAFRTAYLLTGSAADAEDAAQVGFIKAWAALPRFRRGAEFKPWLLRIVVNEAHNVRRAERRHERLGRRAVAHTEPPGPGADETIVAQEEVTTVLRAMARLSDADRLALALRYFAGLSDRDAAALAGASVGAHRVRVLRALARLRRLLEEDGV